MLYDDRLPHWCRQLPLSVCVRTLMHVHLQACGTAELPLPRAQYAVRNDESQFSFGSGDDTPFHLHLDQLNLCFDL